jgi:hypothetical protein
MRACINAILHENFFQISDYMTKRILRLALLLAGLPFLPGCMTFDTMIAAKNGYPRAVHDDYVHAEKAIISKDDQLSIYLKGSITNSPPNSLFTLVIPMADIVTSQSDFYKEIVYVWPTVGTNEISAVILGVRRDFIHKGWLPEGNSNDVETVPVGPEISPQYTFPRGFGVKLPETSWLLRNSNRALYQVRQPGYLEFIYTDASSKRAFTDLQIDPIEDTRPHTEPGYYLLLPVTVPIDVATSPIQIPFIISIMEEFHHQ